MENITFFVERYGVIAVFLNVLLDEGGLPLPSYPLLAIAGALSVGGRPQLVLVLVAALCASACLAGGMAYILCSAPAILRLRLGQPNHSVILALPAVLRMRVPENPAYSELGRGSRLGETPSCCASTTLSPFPARMKSRGRIQPKAERTLAFGHGLGELSWAKT